MTGPLRSAAPLVSRSVLSDETYGVISNLVLEHRIPPGSRVNIDSLSAQLGVSPTPVREALARLESDGLVVKTPLRGYSTTPLLTVKEFVELGQFRVLIEQWTAAESAKSVAPSVADELRAEVAATRESLGVQEAGADAFRTLTEHDTRFHGLIARLAGNELIAQSIERTHFHLHFLRLYLASRNLESNLDAPASQTLRRVLGEFERAGRVSHTIDDHAAIAEAIIAGDGETAADLMREHIEIGRRRFLPIVEILNSID
ncbi:GntR family transcriptional regulator [Agromyces sp. CCNWLW203]|uniref:GntR family transcriptional regulator n=1 Tax=Agromyces sp. CCNWLW203 TaxID=3112842 RepID=UPI002F96343E